MGKIFNKFSFVEYSISKMNEFVEVVDDETRGHKIPSCKENTKGSLYATKYRHVYYFSYFVFMTCTRKFT